MLIASLAIVTGCTVDPGAEPSPGANERGATAADVPLSGDEIAVQPGESATSSELGATTAAQFPCRKVTASSIPVYTTVNGTGISCTFFAGDVFLYTSTFFGSWGTRFETWCPRHTPISQGRIAYAPATGTVAVTCPF